MKHLTSCVIGLVAMLLALAPGSPPATAQQDVESLEPGAAGLMASQVSPATVEGETWFITWQATATGFEDVTDSGTRTVTRRTITMNGSGSPRYLAGEGWKTPDFAWTVTDDYDREVTKACFGGGTYRDRYQHRITDPERVPDYDFLSPSGVGQQTDGSLTMSLWFVHRVESDSTMPAFTYHSNSRTDWCSGPPSISSGSGDGDSYALVLWFNPHMSIIPTLQCDAAGEIGTVCTFHREYTYRPSTTNPPMQVTWSIRAQRMPDSPSIRQRTQLREDSVFFPGVSVINTFDGLLECDRLATCSAKRTVQSGGAVVANDQIGPAPSGNYPKALDIGTLPPGKSTVVAQAVSATPKPPDTKQLRIAVSLPNWIKGAPNISVAFQGDTVIYTWETKLPDPAIESKQFAVPRWVPLFKGEPAKVQFPQVELKSEAKSTGEVTLDGSANGGISMGRNEFKLEVGGEGTGILDDSGVRDTKGKAKLKLSGAAKFEEGVVELIPALRPLVITIDLFSEQIAQELNDLAKIVLEIQASWNDTFNLSDRTGKIEIDSATLEPAIGVTASAVIKLSEDLFSVVVSAGGELKGKFTTPPLKYEEMALDLVAKAKGVFFHRTFEGKYTYTCIFPSGGEADCSGDGGLIGLSVPTTPASWSAADRDYLAAPDYGRWTAPAAGGDLKVQSVDSQTVNDVELVANVYPQASPALAVSSQGQRLLFWSHDDGNRPLTSAQDIQFATRVNADQTWLPATPGTLTTSDDRADFNREVVFTGPYAAVAVWHRFDTASPGEADSDTKEYLKHVQVAASAGTWDRTTSTWTWTAPQQLSTSGSLQSRPRVGAVSGGALAVWIGNPNSQIGGDTTNPDTIYFSRYTASTNTWTAPVAVVTGLTGLVDLRLATNGGTQAAIVYTRDLDLNYANPTDREIFVSKWTSTTNWETPSQLTANGVADDSPLLVMAGTGAPQLVWRQNGTFQFLNGSWDLATATELSLPEAVNASDLRLVRAADGRLALTWQQPTARDTRIGYAIYDPRHQRWGLAGTIVPPVPATDTGTTMATNITSALFADRLLVAYQLATIQLTTVTEGGRPVPNVSEVTEHSLRYAEVVLKRDLTVAAEAITVTPAGAAPGQSVAINAVVRNTSQLTTDPTTIELRQSIAPTTLLTQSIGTLAAGEAVTVTFPYVQPATDAGRLSVYAAYRSTPVPLPVSVTAVSTDYTPLDVQVAALGVQQGAIQGDAGVTATLRLNGSTGPEVGTALFNFPKSVQTTVTATTTLSPTLLGPGRHTVYWTLAATDRHGPVAVSGANVLPDLTLHPGEVKLGAPAGGTTPLTLVVSNRGNWPSSGGRVAVFDRDPGAGGAVALGSLALPDLAPGQRATLTGSLSGTGLPAVYVMLDADATLDELNENNNLFAIGQLNATATMPEMSPKLYLPIVQNQYPQ